MADDVLRDLLEDIRTIPPLPDIAIQVMHLTRDPDATADQLTRLVSSDQGLTANLLKLCNSAYYGLPRTISSVKQAIMYLGFHTVRNLVLTSTMYELFITQPAGYGFTRDGLWKHSVATALAAEQIGKHLRSGLSDAAFTAGLLHDVGKLVMLKRFGNQYPKIKALLEEGLRLVDAEQQLYGFDHTVVGAKIADRWNFPKELIQAIGNHHTPERSKTNSLLTAITHLANCVSSQHGFGLDGDLGRDPISPHATTVTGLGPEDISLFGEKLETSLEEAIEFLVR